MPDRYSLAAVLRLRQHREDMEERALLSLANHRQQVELTLGKVRHQVTIWADDRAREIGRVVAGVAQQGSYAKLAMLRDAETQLQQQMATLQVQIAEQQAKYLAARRDREVLSSLRSQHEKQAQLEGDRREQRRVEDLLLGRWLVQNRN